MDFNQILFLVLGLGLLVFGGEWLVRGASKLAAAMGVAPIIIGLTVVAYGTSTPELAVSLNAALAGNADIAIANVVGSNIFNVLFILGVSALISPLIIHSQMIKREVPIMIGLSALIYFFSYDGNLGQTESFVLFGLIFVYTGWLVYEAKQNKKENKELVDESNREYQLKTSNGKIIAIALFQVVAGLGLVMLGADWLVEGAIAMARTFGVSDAVIGVTIVAAGTSLPEVVASVVATYKGERDIAVGNVVGSNIYNILAILGISGSILPSGLNVDPAMLSLDYPVMFLAAAICLPFFITGKQLSRLEGSILLAMYVGYTTYLISTVS